MSRTDLIEHSVPPSRKNADSPIRDSQQIQCMEVWGGNRGIEKYFRLPGVEVWLYSRPHNAAASGGDVYYLSSCASGRITRLLLADVSGHGPAVSECAGRLRDLMRKHINRVNQDQFVADINRDFTKLGEGNFATALVGTFFASSCTLQLCSAGHPPPLLFNQERGAWQNCNSAEDYSSNLSDLPFGIVDSVDYHQTKVRLNSGDMLLAFSDGVTELRLADDRLLNSSGLLSLAQSLTGTPPADLFSGLVEELFGNSSDSVDDDATLLLLRADGTGTNLRDNLLAPFRIIRGGRDKTNFR